MKKNKIKNFIKRNIKVLTAFVIGIIISGTCVYAGTTLYDSVDVGFDNTTAKLKKNGVDVDNVQDAIDVLYAKAEEAINSKPDCPFEIGEYFKLTPTQTTFTIYSGVTGYGSDQTITPNELNLWRVIDIHSDGSFDAVSEYVSSTGVYFQGATGYQYFVSTLELIASQYAKAWYTIDTRMMGYGGQTPVIQPKASSCTGTCQKTTTYAFDGSTNSPPGYSTGGAINGVGYETSGGVGGDELYLKDYQLVSNVYKSDTTTYGSTGKKAYKVGTTTATAYWIASRSFGRFSASNFSFYGRYVNENGGEGTSSIRYFNSGWGDRSYSKSFRPILTLRSGIQKSGSHAGTKEDPYELA